MSKLDNKDDALIPSLTPEIDSYLDEIKDKIDAAQMRATKQQRTSDFTVTAFADTKRDRLWAMKMKGEFIDAVLVTEDGHQEPVHLAVVLALEPYEPIFRKAKSKLRQDDSSKPREYLIKSDISAATLRELVFFAYHRRCKLNEGNVLAMATIGHRYGINALVQHCILFLMEHCSLQTAIGAFELSCKAEFTSKKAQAFFQKYIEDNFEELWELHSNDLLALMYPLLSCMLKWNKLNVRSESTVWLVIRAWVAHELSDRLHFLPGLLKSCLRLGRLPESYIEQSIFSSDVFCAQNGPMQTSLRVYVNKLLHGDGERKLAINGMDGHGLMYSKSDTAFRPRETRQLILAAGGWVDGKTTPLIEVYDYQLNLWLSSRVQLSHPVSYFGFELIDSVVYVFGGSNGLEIFSTVTACDLSQSKCEWVTKASMIERRSYVSSAVLNKFIYAIGGLNQQSRVRKCERYDPTTDTWTPIADLNYARSGASTVAYNGCIYIAGGINDNNIEQSVEVYRPETDTWILVKSMGTPRTSLSIAEFGGRIWAIGGYDGENPLRSCESYDPETDSWSNEEAMGHNRSSFKAIQFNGKLYAVGGYNGQSPISNVEKYVPGQGWIQVRHLRHERSGMALLAIPNHFAMFKI